MNAKKLYTWNLSPAGVWFCEKCRRVFASEYDANTCCSCLICREPVGDKPYHNHYHRECWDREEARRDAQRIAEAQTVSDYDGPVYCEGYGHSDGYFGDIDELLGYLADEDADSRPEWAFCCTITKFEFDLGWALESQTDDLHEDAIDCLPPKALEDLRAAVKTFNAAVKGSSFASWHVDYKRKVAVPVAEAANA